MKNHKDLFSHDERVNYSFFKTIDENEVKTGFSNSEKKVQGNFKENYFCLICKKNDFENFENWKNHDCSKNI
jgi:hypothetical protein